MGCNKYLKKVPGGAKKLETDGGAMDLAERFIQKNDPLV